MKNSLAKLGLVALFSAVLSPGIASAGDSDHASIRLWGGVNCRCVLKDNDTFLSPKFGTSETAQDGQGYAFGGDVEFLPVKHFGLGAGVGYTKINTTFSHSIGAGVQEDHLKFVPIFLSANIHLVNNGKVDFYIGYLAAYVKYLNDPTYTVPNLGTYTVTRHNQFSHEGFNVGADVHVTKNWAINGAFRWIDADADVDHNLPLDPTFITVGISRKF